MIPINRKLKVDVIFFRRKETNYQLTSDNQTKRKEHSGNSLYKLQEAVCEVYRICQDGPICSTDGKLKVGERGGMGGEKVQDEELVWRRKARMN